MKTKKKIKTIKVRAEISIPFVSCNNPKLDERAANLIKESIQNCLHVDFNFIVWYQKSDGEFIECVSKKTKIKVK